MEHLNLNIKGTWRWWLLRDQRIVEWGKNHNLVVNGSRPLIANVIREHPLASPIRAVAIGTSSTGTQLTQTDLQAEVFRKAIPVADTDTPTSANIISLSPSTVVTIRQMLSPFLANDGIPSAGLSPSIVIREFGLFGDIAEIANPSVVLSGGNVTAGSSGTVTPGIFNLTYTWSNPNGETTAPTAYAYTLSGPNNSFTVALPAPPAQANQVNLYIGGFLYASTNINLSAPTIVVNTDPPGSGQVPPSVNTSLKPGILNSGTMLNRALVGPITLNDGDRIIVESILNFG